MIQPKPVISRSGNSEQDWFKSIAGLFEHIDKPEFPRQLLNLIKSIVEVDCSLIVAFRKQKRPALLLDDLAHKWRENRASDYLAAAYMLDPFYISSVSGIEPGLYRLENIAPDGFMESEYYRTYYVNSHVCDEVCYLFPVDNDVTLIVSLERGEKNPQFNDEDIDALRQLQEIVYRSLCKYWLLYASGDDGEHDPNEVGDTIQRAFETFGSSILTNRECEVVRLLLSGHSNRSLAEKLGITPGTAKVHREKIYAKLDISSQSELFHLFIDSVSSHTDGATGDPLQSYLSTG